MQSFSKTVRILIFIATLSIWLFTAARAVSLFNLSPDSADYINAAQNLLATGRMFVHANSPTWSLGPEEGIYTEHPPGLPLMLAPFLLVIREPVLSAAALQVVIILALFASIYALGISLRMGPLARLACSAAFALFTPLVFISPNFWSETPFIALTLWSIYFLGKSGSSAHPLWDWWAGLCLGAAASGTRLVGILSLPVFVIAAWRQRGPRWRQIFLAVLFSAGPLAGWFLRNRILYGQTSFTQQQEVLSAGQKLIQTMAFLRDLISPQDVVTTLIAIFCLAAAAAPFLGRDLKMMQGQRLGFRRRKMVTATLVATTAGILLWAFGLAMDRLRPGGSPGLGLKQIALLLAGLLVLGFGWIRHTNLADLSAHWRHGLDRGWYTSRQFFTYLLILLAGAAHLGGNLVLSQLIYFDPLEYRLLGPSLALLLMAVLAGLHHLLQILPGRSARLIVAALALWAVLYSPAFIKTGLGFTPGFTYPPEKLVWQELAGYPGLDKASHFYSDDDFVHEIYAGRPQRIIPLSDWSGQEILFSGLMKTGTCPFVLVTRESGVASQLDVFSQAAGLRRRDLLGGAFILYAQDCLFTASPDGS